MQNADNKSNKIVVLATYGVAVLCLIMGLVLPLFNGKEVLVLKLADVFKSLLNKPNNFSLGYAANVFGLTNVKISYISILVVLYTAITAVAVIGLVPVILSTIKEGKLAKKFGYGIEIAAIIVLALFFIPTLRNGIVCYNMVIAGCGTAVALLALTGADKDKKATVKIVLFILSLIGFLALFDYVALLSKETAFEKLSISKKLSSGLTGFSGVGYLTLLYATNISKYLELLDDAKSKMLIIFAAITATVVLLNFFIDTVKVATNSGKKGSKIFDIIRYGLEILLAAVVLILGIACKAPIGLMLIAVLAVAIVEFIIAIVKLLKRRNESDEKVEAYEDVAVEDTDAYKAAEPILLADGSEEENYDDINLDQYSSDYEENYGGDYEETYNENEDYNSEPVAEEELEQDEPSTPVPPVPDEDGYVDPELDAKYQQQLLEEKQETAEEYLGTLDDENLEDVELYEPGPDTTYLINEDEPVEKLSEEVEEPVEEEPTEEIADEPSEELEPVEEVEEPVEEAEPVEEPVEEAEPVEEVAEEIADEPSEEPEPVEEPVEEAEPVEEPVEEAEPVEEVAEAVTEEPVEEEANDGLEEPAQNPFREVKPYNPYEKHNNPFKQFEEPPQTYNPYRQPEKPVQYEKIQPTRPAYEPRRYEQPERPARPLQPRPIIQEFKPVPPVSEQPPRDTRIYTIDTLYAGPIDDFIRKLSNEERIEFAKTFLEKNKGSLGSIPDYVVGGDNKKFFSASFIYLGRIRGMVSDGLLNKMYKEINLL